MLNQAEASIYI